MNGIVIRTMPGGPLTGLPEFRPYRYRGTGRDTLTAWMDDWPPCGRPMASGQRCGRRRGHKGHHKGAQAIAADRATSTERSRRSRQRKAAA